MIGAAVRTVTSVSGGRVTVTLGFPTDRQRRAFYEMLLACQETQTPIGLVVVPILKELADENQSP